MITSTCTKCGESIHLIRIVKLGERGQKTVETEWVHIDEQTAWKYVGKYATALHFAKPQKLDVEKDQKPTPVMAGAIMENIPSGG